MVIADRGGLDGGPAVGPADGRGVGSGWEVTRPILPARADRLSRNGFGLLDNR
ncbi:hypothetical protein GCM10009608_01110 [Pseudonocardia alaniniphila]